MIKPLKATFFFLFGVVSIAASASFFDTLINVIVGSYHVRSFANGVNYFAHGAAADFCFVLLTAVLLLVPAVVLHLMPGRRSGGFAERWYPFVFGTCAATLAVFLVAVPVNFSILPGVFSTKSMLFNLLFVLAIPVLALLLIEIGRRFYRRLKKPIFLLSVFVVVALVFVAVGYAVNFDDHVSVESRTLDGPNVLIITIDALRRDHLSCYSDEYVRTPNIDEFAGRSLLFNNAFTNSPWTVPSMYTMLTSSYPSVHGADLTHRGNDNLITLAQILKAHGYSTEAYVANHVLYAELGFDRGFERYVEFGEPTSLGWMRRSTVYHFIKYVNNKAQSVFGDNDTTKWLTEVLVSRLSATRERPFFIWAHYLDPHSPLTPPAEYIDGKAAFVEDALALSEKTKTFGSSADMREEDRDLALALYGAEVKYVDRSVGKVLSVIEDNGLLEDTIVIITADHGEEFFEHGRYGHGKTHYFEVTAVPLIIYAPDIEPRVREEPAALVDLVPSLVHYVSPETDAGFSGVNLFQERSEVTEGGRGRFIFFDETEFDPNMKSVYLEPFIFSRTGSDVYTYEVTDVTKEPPYDVIPGPEPGTFEPYRETLEEFVAETNIEAASLGGEAKAIVVGADRREKLRDLGYLK
jgi:arylsulfatase A-like enzyme